MKPLSSSPVAPPSMLALCGLMLRAPADLVARGSHPKTIGAFAPRVLLIALGSALVFGAVVGSYRGGVQIAYAAVKMPLLFVIPLLVTIPALGALLRVFGLPLDKTRLGLAGLVGMARIALVAAAAAPVLWLLYSLTPGYHLATVLLAATLLLAGAAGLPALLSAVAERNSRSWAAAMLGAVLLGVSTAQTGWVLRPFVARPRGEVALLRPIEGDAIGSLLRIPLAAADIYLPYSPERSSWRSDIEEK